MLPILSSRIQLCLLVAPLLGGILLGCSSDEFIDHRGETRPARPQGGQQGIPPGQIAPQTQGQAGGGTTPGNVPPGPVANTAIHASGGAGGGVGLQEVSFTDSVGTKSSYKINAPQVATSSPTAPLGLHIHFHGDGGGGYKDFPNRESRGNLIGVTVKAPNGALTWGRAEGVGHAKFVQDLIQNELVKKYNIDLDRIYFSGVSGGSYFLSGHFIPMFGRTYHSGAFLMCGGMSPQVTIGDGTFLKTFRIHWETTAGERSDIKNSVKQSHTAYRKVLSQFADANPGIESNNEEGPGGHCEFDGTDYTSGIQFMMDKKFATIVKP